MFECPKCRSGSTNPLRFLHSRDRTETTGAFGGVSAGGFFGGGYTSESHSPWIWDTIREYGKRCNGKYYFAWILVLAGVTVVSLLLRADSSERLYYILSGIVILIGFVILGLFHAQLYRININGKMFLEQEDQPKNPPNQMGLKPH